MYKGRLTHRFKLQRKKGKKEQNSKAEDYIRLGH
jgi:hypothetical protein